MLVVGEGKTGVPQSRAENQQTQPNYCMASSPQLNLDVIEGRQVFLPLLSFD